jgi:hypothetical protein
MDPTEFRISINPEDVAAPTVNPNPPTRTAGETCSQVTVDCPGGTSSFTLCAGDVVALQKGCQVVSEVPVVITDTLIGARSRSWLTVPGANPEGRVGCAVFPNGETVLGWANATTSELNFLRLMGSWGADGEDFGSVAAVSETSTQGVSLAAWGSTQTTQEQIMQVAWTGTDSSATLNVAQLTMFEPFPEWAASLLNGKQILAPQSSASAVALAADADRGDAYLAWIGTDENRTLNVMCMPNGQTPSQAILWGENSDTSPNLLYQPGRSGAPIAHLYLTWQGTDSGQSINILDIDLGNEVADQFVVNASTLCAPALAAVGDQFLMAWIDAHTGQLALAQCPEITPSQWQMMTLFDATPIPENGLILAAVPQFDQVIVAAAKAPEHLSIDQVPLDPSIW